MTALYFSAPWCLPCKTFKTRAKEIILAAGQAFTEINVDVDHYDSDLNIMSLPTIVFFDGTGLESARVTGADERGLRAALR